MNESPTPRRFEDALADLERLVRELEQGQLGLDEALAAYEQGVALVRDCTGRLRDAEQRIAVLTGLDGDGQPTLQPFQHQATAPAEKPGRRRRKESDQPPAW